MTLVDRTTGEIVEITYGQVRESVASAKASLEQAAEQIVWQIENRTWVVLGYADWNEMREAEYGGAAFMVPRAERPELVARMRRSGLTQQEIADTAGISTDTVQRDLNTADAALSGVTVTNSRGQQRPASYAKPSPAPAAPSVEPSADETDLRDFIAGDQSVQDTSYMKQFLTVAQRAQEVGGFDVERLARIADDADALVIENLAATVAQFHRQFNARRSGLRVIKGGAR